MIVSVFAYSVRGCKTARKIGEALGGDALRFYTVSRLAEGEFVPIPQPSREFYGEHFSGSDALIFVGSCGIAVRQIAPFVRSKQTDPAVLVVDELGKQVIPLLSGHIGGANAMALHLSRELGASPIITTATDINGRFAADSWAAKHGYMIDNMAAAKAVSGAILEGDIPMRCDFPLSSSYPTGVVPGEAGKLGILVSVKDEKPFDTTLRLIPRILHLGIGCRKGTPEADIAAAVRQTLLSAGIDQRAVRCVASIDLKSGEAGLLSYCARKNWPIAFYSARELRQVPGSFSGSDFVKKVTGVENVCERSALLGADRLLVKKTALCGVTVAVAAEKLEVSFE